MRMRMNPIVKKDIRVQSRSMRICWSVFAYEAIMALVFFIAMLVLKENSRYSVNNIYNGIIGLYPVLGVTQLIILGVVVPVRTASSISGEKERQTFDIMMTTSMTPFSIILGKAMTAVVQDIFFVAASMPVMALAFVIGGLPWSYLFWFLGVALLVSLFSASIGILCSSLCKKSITAVIMSYGIYVVFFLGTLLPIGIVQYMYMVFGYASSMSTENSLSYIALLLNPAVYLLEFFVGVMTGESMVGSLVSLSTTKKGIMTFVTSGHWWMILSTILFVAVSFLFLWLASKRINPIKGRAKKVMPRRMEPPKMAQGNQL
ncbi:MAG: ABC transporter permease [Muribaculaceae bacterium]|nr:ABC transporter permease [Roseburia sp.]MCM1431161.1 ABC transporter permease [Muribaculaceae bacterium]MCM1492584.1 ABC transporter permease [Muribaculaceae bacterium]